RTCCPVESPRSRAAAASDRAAEQGRHLQEGARSCGVPRHHATQASRDGGSGKARHPPGEDRQARWRPAATGTADERASADRLCADRGRVERGRVPVAARTRARHPPPDGLRLLPAPGTEVLMNELLAKSPHGGRKRTLEQHTRDVIEAAEA